MEILTDRGNLSRFRKFYIFDGNAVFVPVGMSEKGFDDTENVKIIVKYP